MKEILLAVPVLLPIAGGAGMLALHLGSRGKRDDRRLTLLTEGLVVINSLVVFWLLRFRMGAGLVLFRLFGNLTVRFELDPMGGVFAGLIAFLWPLATLYSFEYMKQEERKTTFFAYYVMTYGVTSGIALAGNLVTMYLCYEMLTLVTFPLVLFPMTKEAKRASRRYLYYSIGGAAFAFIGLVFVLSFSITGNTDFVPGGVLNLEAAGAQKNLLLLVYVLAFCGFGVKAALFPLHGWLPKATVAPTPVTALLHAVAVVKSGAFAILRFTYYSYGTEFLQESWAQWVVMTAALATIVFGSTMAVREIHWKRRLAYSTVSNLSYILFGATMMSPLGLAAALSHLVVHAFMKICSFFCAGAVMHQTGKTQVYELDGLGKEMPVTFACLTVASLSLMGIPLFGGFISKWNLVQAAFACGGLAAGCRDALPAAAGMPGSGNALAAAAGAPGSGNILSAAGTWLPYVGVAVILYSALMTGIYMLTVLVRAYFPKVAVSETGKEEDGNIVSREESGAKCQKRRDPGWMMLLPLLIFAAVILVLGLHSAPLMRLLTEIGGEAG